MGEITLTEMLEARERRARRQQALLREGGSALICFTMNIAGPVKNSELIRQGFRYGQRLLEEQPACRSSGRRSTGRTRGTRPSTCWRRRRRRSRG